MAVKTINQGRMKNLKLEYIIDSKNRRIKVILPVKQYEKLTEDLHDMSVIADRINDKVIPFDEINYGIIK